MSGVANLLALQNYLTCNGSVDGTIEFGNVLPYH
jgi:hypothetical protein